MPAPPPQSPQTPLSHSTSRTHPDPLSPVLLSLALTLPLNPFPLPDCPHYKFFLSSSLPFFFPFLFFSLTCSPFIFLPFSSTFLDFLSTLLFSSLFFVFHLHKLFLTSLLFSFSLFSFTCSPFFFSFHLSSIFSLSFSNFFFFSFTYSHFSFSFPFPLFSFSVSLPKHLHYLFSLFFSTYLFTLLIFLVYHLPTSTVMQLSLY